MFNILLAENRAIYAIMWKSMFNQTGYLGVKLRRKKCSLQYKGTDTHS